MVLTRYLPSRRFLTGLACTASLAALAGCSKAVVLNPAGDVAARQGQMVVHATLLMLIIIVPVIALTLWFAWKYRHSNPSSQESDYEPDWHHSTQLELVIWTVPLMIIIALGAMTWIGTHKLDPYRPLERLSATKPLENVAPLEVRVVALDWKWLFFYPDQGIATVNELAAPVDRPIRFLLTSSNTMNSFYVPDLAGMIYSMPGMQTELNAVINKPGVYHGLASHYSGAGFSGMTFKFHGLDEGQFAQWVANAKAKGSTLDRAAYQKLVLPSERDPVQYFASVEPDLYDRVLNRCVEDGKLCMHHMMAIDARGGQSHATAKGLNLPADICTVNESIATVAALDASTFIAARYRP